MYVEEIRNLFEDIDIIELVFLKSYCFFKGDFCVILNKLIYFFSFWIYLSMIIGLIYVIILKLYFGGLYILVI